MKAAIYFGAQDVRCEDIAVPEIEAHHEVLVKVIATSICGSDLHVYGGALEAIMEKGKSQTGHELIGTIVECGNDVAKFKPGDRVTMGYSCSCGACHMCDLGQTAHCEKTQNAVYGFGTAFGALNGTHAEYLRLPYADGHAMTVPEEISDAAAVTLSCNLPSAMIANQLADIQPGDNVAIVGCGPTGLMALEIARQRNPRCLVAFDRVLDRLQMAADRGAEIFNAEDAEHINQSLTHTGDRGFDKVIEVVGSPQSLQAAIDLVRPGGTIAAIGVFTTDTFNLNLADVFLRDISLHMNGFANVQPVMSEAMRLLQEKLINVDDMFTHEFRLGEIDKAYKTFHQQLDGASKVLIRP
jgi:alcohol dehydrogenase